MTLDVDVGASRDGFVLQAEFTAEVGETVALLGPNGAGKSTLVEVLAGLLAPERGRVVLDGSALDDASRGVHVAPERRPIGVVFQDLLLFPHLSAVENVAFPLRAHGIRRREAWVLALAALGRLGIAHLAGARPLRLSGGEAQRVALARALIAEPKLLLLDEPLSALDVAARGQIRELVKDTLRSFAGVSVLVTHDPVDAMIMADRLVLLESGRITQAGSPQEIRTAPRTPYAAELVGVNLFTGRLEPMERGAGRLITESGSIVVGWPSGAAAVVEGVRAVLRPVDVALHSERPTGGSARNVLRGRISSIRVEGERARVGVRTEPPLVSEVTLGSVSRLALAEGVEVWASFKAVEVSVLLP